ncbi:hypothetical protein PV325_007352, partial [Microctonus aethiopoides]
MENPAEYDVTKDIGDEDVDEDKIDKTKYREVCWILSERGAVGETILHLCMLNATALHADLAKRLLRFYPKLINDIYISDEYYGENVLHIAIVNEDPAMVKYLLDSGADVHERCFGNFMCPEDQKASRTDSLDHEWVSVTPETNYDGYVYWGEYPLSFAACLGQEECYRLMLARGADPDKQDTNGNTVLHMLVIYQKLGTFDMAYEVGASLSIRNIQQLTPLTLSAKLARIEMFFHIMNIEREIYWQIGSITCAAYPLSQVDTIDVNTGTINNNSALNLVVFGEKDEHLELMDGVLVDLLNAKWNTFIKSRFYRQFFLFCFYFVLSLISFVLRPGPSPISSSTNNNNTSAKSAATSSTFLTTPAINHQVINLELSLSRFIQQLTSVLTSNVNITSNNVDSFISQLTLNVTTALKDNFNLTYNSDDLSWTSNEDLADLINNNYSLSAVLNARMKNITNSMADASTTVSESETTDDWWEDLTEECRLMNFESSLAKIRLTTEIFMEIGAILYIAAALREARFLGLNMFIENLMTAPSRVMFLISCCILLSFPFLRLSCADKVEDMLAVVVMLTTAPYFLFFCRGFKTVGPFVVMIYRMIMGDLLRFVSIYLVFVMGFSQ